MEKIDKSKSPEMFNKIAATYDRANIVLSFGMDRIWRNYMAKSLPEDRALRVLDVATGTGDSAIVVLRHRKVASLIGLDPAEHMLKYARRKVKKHFREAPATFVQGDALAMTFLDNEFDVVTMAFGIRNVTDPMKAMLEMHRVLKEDGQIRILEFSLPESKLIQPFFFLYIRHLLPKIGKMISGDGSAYSYLNKTIETFPYGEAFCDWMRDAGFKNVHIKTFLFGGVTLYMAEK